MDEKILKSLYDVKMAIDEIDMFLATEEKTFSNLSLNNMISKMQKTSFR